MALPQQIAVRYAEDGAGFVSMQPVVKQVFRLAELADMVVSVVGKDAGRVQRAFRRGAVTYNGYHYWWEPLAADVPELEEMLSSFPDDDPSRTFEPATVTQVVFEMGGGAQRSLVEILKQDAAERRLFGKISPWDVLLHAAAQDPPRYEEYSHARHADLFRLTLPFPRAQQLLAAMLNAAPRGLRHRWSGLRPPAALTFVCPR